MPALVWCFFDVFRCCSLRKKRLHTTLPKMSARHFKNRDTFIHSHPLEEMVSDKKQLWINWLLLFYLYFSFFIDVLKLFGLSYRTLKTDIFDISADPSLVNISSQEQALTPRSSKMDPLFERTFFLGKCDKCAKMLCLSEKVN